MVTVNDNKSVNVNVNVDVNVNGYLITDGTPWKFICVL